VLDRADAEMVRHAMRLAWRTVAPKALVAMQAGHTPEA
jgi:hypothetical protein